MQAALSADIAYAVESRAFLSADERQVRNYDETGAAAEVSDLDLHKDFMQAADKVFLPVPAPVQGMDLA